MLKDHYNEVMNGNDTKAINWLMSFAEKNPSLKESITAFNKYYEQCLKVLKEKVLTDEEIKNATRRIKPIFNYLKNPSFREKLLINNQETNTLPIFTEEQLDSLLKIELGKDDNENILQIMSILGKTKNETEAILTKIDRFYNMQLKYGHTARITYIAACNIEKTGIKNEVAIKAILTSALMHDIGRFYQAANYNTLIDSEMDEKIIIDQDGQKIDLQVDHAIAGYYYSLMDLYQLSSLGQAEYKDLIIHSIAAVVVRFHQMSNKLLKEFETKATNFNFKDDLETQLITFIIDSYKNADLLKRRQSKYMYDSKHINFIDKIINRIVEENRKRIQSQLENTFINVDYNEKDREEQIQMITNALDTNYESIENRLITYYNNPNSEEGKQILKEIIMKIKAVVNSSKGFEMITSDEIETIIKALPEYDIAKSVSDRLKKGEVPKEVKKVFNVALNYTMDADKIEILNQRATGIYNTEYNPSSFKVYPGESKTLVDILNDHFAFKLDKDNLYINNNIVIILNRNLKPDQKTWFKNQGINLDDLLEQTKKSSLKIEPTHPLYNMIAITPWKKVIANDKRHKKDYTLSEMPVVVVPREIIDENLQGQKEQDKIKTYRNLIITPEQINLFQTSDDFSRDVRGLQSEYQGGNQEHITWNPVAALMWQLNQFIMVNMRTKASIEYIRENKILENIYNQYKQAPIIQNVLKPFIAYTLLFTDVLIALKTNGKGMSLTAKDETYKDILTYDARTMTKVKNIVSNKEVFGTNIILKYCQYLEDNSRKFNPNYGENDPKMRI